MEMLSEFISMLSTNPNICIAGPSGEKNGTGYLRIYAYGGVLFKVGKPNNYKVKLMSKSYTNYLDTNLDQEDRDEICKTINRSKVELSEAISFMKKHGEALLSACKNKFQSETQKPGTSGTTKLKERANQTLIAHMHQFGNNDGALIFDFEPAITSDWYTQAYKHKYGLDKKKKPKADLCAYRMNSEGKPEFRLLELKCNLSACRQEGKANASGIRDHAIDMSVCIEDEKIAQNIRKLLYKRFEIVTKYIRPNFDMPKLDDIVLSFGFLFSDDDDITKQRAVEICQEKLVCEGAYKLKPDNYYYQFGSCKSDSVDPIFNIDKMQTWEEFCK